MDCHTSPLLPQHYCPECGTYNADEEMESDETEGKGEG